MANKPYSQYQYGENLSRRPVTNIFTIIKAYKRFLFIYITELRTQLITIINIIVPIIYFRFCYAIKAPVKKERINYIF